MLGKPYKKRRGKRFLALLLTAVLTVSGAGLVPSSLAEASEATESPGDVREIDPGGVVLPEESLEGETQFSSEDGDVLAGDEATLEEGEQVPEEEEATPEEGEQVPEEEDATLEEEEQVPTDEVDVSSGDEAAPEEGEVIPEEGAQVLTDEAEVPGEYEVSPAAEADDATPAGTYVLEAKSFGEADKANADPEKAGTDNYFTIYWGSKGKVDTTGASFEDGYAPGYRINFGGGSSKDTDRVIKFTTSGKATIKIWWVCGDVNRQMVIYDSESNEILRTKDGDTKNKSVITTWDLDEAGAYTLSCPDGTNYILKVEVEETPASIDYTLEAKSFGEVDKSNADPEKAGTNNYFTIYWGSKGKVDTTGASFEDGYAPGYRINFGGGSSKDTDRVIKFTTSGKATIKIWWVCGDVNRQMVVYDSESNEILRTKDGDTKNKSVITTWELDEAGAYTLSCPDGSNYILKVVVTEGAAEKAPRAEWDTVADPEIINVEQDGNDINVTVSANVGYDGADRLTVTMTGENATEDKGSIAEKTEHVLTFAPANSGTYTFFAKISRDGEEDKAAVANKSIEFVFPLTAPVIKGAYNDGNGTVTVEWSSVHEADSYNVTAGDQTQNVTGTSATFEGLTVGEEVTFTVVAVRGEEVGPASSITTIVTEDGEMRWAFSAFGNSTSTSKNTYEGSYNEGTVTVRATGGGGKIQESSHDGISFYYTAIDPETTNFILEATGHVNEWTYSNGQEGFGLAALDRVGVHGSSDTGAIFYNNSYMTAITRFSGMRLGVGAIEKWGTNLDNFSNPEGDGFSALITNIAPSFAGSGTRNMVGNATNQDALTSAGITTIENPIVDFRLRLEKNNTGYFMTYIDPDGNEVTKKTYDPENLTMLDDKVYIGFFAARNFDVTFTDISLTFSDPADDAPAEERPAEYVAPSYGFSDRGVSNSAEGELIYRGNVDGTIIITDATGKEIYNGEVTANTNLFVSVALEKGANTFNVTVTPDSDFHPDGLSYKWLTSYEPWTGTQTITYQADDRDVVYVSPNGSSDAAGTKENPTTLAAAVQWAAPGQEIILLEGTYNLSSSISIRRGINGTADKMITLKADPDAASRPILDFGGTGGGFTIEGNYWHLYGFDITGSTGNGIHVAGSYNVVERVNTYRNGNTGLQISRQGSFDGIAEWPSYNLILNCSSYLNADPGYEDADGFAAKLTVGEGNVFDGCISAYNADDGWDLFARGERIGTVTIKNSIAFKNGWILDENGNEINAGNGNGFKMGGSGYEGGHQLIDSVAFANKANGITCNSCPDIVVKNSISFDNGSANLALYSSITGQSTNFSVNGYISYGKSSASADNIKPTGTQTVAELQKASNYYFDGNVSVNINGRQVDDTWFENLETDTAINDRVNGIGRNEDGTINMNGYLVLTDAAVTPEEPDDNSGSYYEEAEADVDWNKVNVDVQAEQGLTEGNNLNVRAGSQLIVPGNVVETLDKSKVSIAMHVNNGVAFSLSGNEVTAAAKKGIDLSNSVGSIAVPGDVLAQKLAGTLDNKQISLKNEASFGMNVNIHASFGSQYAGRYANLYRFNKQTGQFEYAGSFRITEAGQAMFGISRGGEYLITVTAGIPNEVVVAGNTYTVKSGDTLSRIASRYKMSLAEILRLNPQIKDANKIYPGQVFTVR